MSLLAERLLRPLRSGNASGGRSVKWVDGLRGCASASVVLSHLARAFDYNLFHAVDAEGKSPRLGQLPFIRLLFQGRIGVATFALLTGYVCGLKALRQTRGGDPHAALATLAKSAFGRVPRLMIPATIATIFGMIMAQLGGFVVAKRCDSVWINYSSIAPEHNLWLEFLRLIRVIRKTWTTGANPYDDHQWALLPLLKVSLHMYLVLSAVVFLKFKYRAVVYLLVFAFFWQDHRPDTETFACMALWGLFLCDLSLHPPFQAFMARKNGWIRRVSSVLLMMVGLYIASFPLNEPDLLAWSRNLHKLRPVFMPDGSNETKRFAAFGMLFFALGIVLNNTVKEILSSPALLFLGRYSFAVYLIHGTLLRSVLMWMIYGFSGQPWVVTTDEKGEKHHSDWLKRGGSMTFLVAIPIWLVLVYSLAHLWTTYVDTWAGKVVKRLQDAATEPDEKHMPRGALPT